MKTDAYTKAVLTVIAACLVCLVTRDAPPLVPLAHAATSGLTDVNIVKINGVDIPDSGMGVNIWGVDGSVFATGQVSASKPQLPVKQAQ